MKFAVTFVMVSALGGLAGCDEQGETKNLAEKKTAPPENSQIVLVSMAGWTQTADTMQAIEQTMIRSLQGCFPNHKIEVKRRLLGLLPEGDSELFLSLEYEAWKQRKNTPAGRDDLFLAVGHSSGATAIYSLLRNGTFKDGKEAPAFLGLVDMVLPLGPHDLAGKTPRNGARRTVIVHYHTSEAESINGIRNVHVGSDHFSVIHSGTVLQGLAGNAVNACVSHHCPDRQDLSQVTDENKGHWE
ncbi:MAG: hypothetical protein JXA11_17060 [Phycisphaerae bacterium]|nr:hypothetical protein [Phycisphaerae bacterium]